MSFIQLSEITPDKNNIKPGDTINLGYTIDGDDKTPVKITYSINSDNNVYFVLGNGNLDKTMTTQTTLDTPPNGQNQPVTIQKVTTGGTDFSQFNIYVQAVNTLNGNTDIKHCNITFQ